MGKHFYCPYCGATQFETNVVCIKCRNYTNMVESKHDDEYYRNKSLEKYGDYSHWNEFLLPEIKENPLFDEEKHNYKPSSEEQHKRHQKILDDIMKNKMQNSNPNQPKCPTCGSTNIEKISTTSRVTHGLMFGLFSKTAKSQFRCKNCGNKW